MGNWVTALESEAPDIVGAWRGIEAEQFLSVRREVRRRAGPGSATGILAQLDALLIAIVDLVDALAEDAFALPGGEADWNVAQTVGHIATSRAGLALAAGLAASGRWPPDAPTVIPGVPGPIVDKEELLRKLSQSQRIVARAAAQRVGTAPADESVGTGATGEGVVVRAAVQLVRARAAVHRVGSVGSLELVGARRARDRVVASAASQVIASAATVQRIVAQAPVERVGTAVARECVGEIGAENVLEAGQLVATEIAVRVQ